MPAVEIAPAMHSWKKTFVSAFTAQILSILGFSFALPFLPFFIADLGVTDTSSQAFWAGVVMGASGLTFAIFSPLWGLLADRYGRKLMVCRSMAGGTVVLLLMSYVQSITQLIICRLLQGAFTGTIAASIALVASVVPRKRSGFTLGMMQTAVFLGASIGPFFGGIVADAFGYRASFRFGALLCLLGGVLVYFGTEEKIDPHPAENEPPSEGFKSILMSSGFLIAVLIMFGVQFGNTLINPAFPLIIKDLLPSTQNLNSIAGSIMAAAALAGAFSAAVLGHAGDRLGHRRVLIGCCLAGGLAAGAHYWAFSLQALVTARVLFGLAIASMLPAANAMIHSIIDHRSLGKAYGLASSISMTGVALGPLVGGYLAKIAGLRMPFLVTAAAQLMIGLLILFYFDDTKRHTPASGAGAES